MEIEKIIEGLKKLREPFPENQIGKLAKGSKAQTQCPNSEKRKCSICGGFHHPQMIHLDYVGHAALTDRLLDVDPFWKWEPFALTDKGLPAFDASGGLWIKLTVLTITRPGYGNAEPSQYKEVGSREKEVIGDALRNAAMRFGAALELWHKGDLHAIIEEDEPAPKKETPAKNYEQKEPAQKSKTEPPKIDKDITKIHEIGTWLLEMGGNNQEVAKDLLKSLTKFGTFQGFEDLEELTKIKSENNKRFYAIYCNIKRKHDEFITSREKEISDDKPFWEE